jgi:hypothetical protein
VVIALPPFVAGLIAWFTNPSMVQKGTFYGDNDGTVFISTVALVGLLASAGDSDGRAAQHSGFAERTMPLLLEQIFGNLRTTGQYGYRPCSTRVEDMAKGWRGYFDGLVDETATTSTPHMQSNLQASFLWAGEVTGVALFQQRVYEAVRRLMSRWPAKWLCWEYMSEELAHEVLVLSWLVRVNNTAEPRRWLAAVAGKLIDRQHKCGAVREYVNASCALNFITTNSAYGNGEGGLMASNDDPVADLLYTQNFALMSLHEATHAVGPSTVEGQKYTTAADALAGFLVRSQVQSKAQPYLDGAWIRGIDVQRWEYWASATDSGYGKTCVVLRYITHPLIRTRIEGPWETETGWTIGWISATLGMRSMNTSWWDTMQHAAGAVNPKAVHGICLDYFEDKGPMVCKGIRGDW